MNNPGCLDEASDSAPESPSDAGFRGAASRPMIARARAPPTAARQRSCRPGAGGGAAGPAGRRLWRLAPVATCSGAAEDSQALAEVRTQVQALDGKPGGSGRRKSQPAAAGAVRPAARPGAGHPGAGSRRERSRSLENAVAGLTARARNPGHDAVRLDEAAMLLRMADERFALFHDADGAMRAYAMADHVLGEVEDPAYAARAPERRQRAQGPGCHPPGAAPERPGCAAASARRGRHAAAEAAR